MRNKAPFSLSGKGDQTVFKSAEEMFQFVKESGVEQIDFKASDLFGRWHHIAFSTRNIDPSILTKGSGLSLSPYVGFRKVHQGDMIARPDVTTAFLDPFYEQKTLSVICDLFYPEGQPYERNPRNIARRAEEQIAAQGIDGESSWLPEMEFYILEGARFGSAVNTAYYDISSQTGSWHHGKEGEKLLYNRLTNTGLGQCDRPRDRHGDLRAEMVKRIEEAGYAVKYNHHELGGAGQCEIEPYFGGLLYSADSVMVMKYVIQAVARARGYTTTFMPKPLIDAPGNGMHFHQYLVKEGKSLFYDANAEYANLNEMALYYTGGLLEHTPALMALCCPGTNSYRRFGVGLAAPMNLFFSEANRSSAVRIPAYDKSPEGLRVEYRLPDGLCNPYLACAAQLMAGLDGIRNKIDPSKAGYGPFDVNNYEMSKEERAKIKSGPVSLKESLAALDEDRGFLTQGGVFPDDVIDTWIELKLGELDELSRRPHPYEFELYYDL